MEKPKHDEKSGEASDTPALDALIRMDKSKGPVRRGDIPLPPAAERAHQYLERLHAERDAQQVAKTDDKQLKRQEASDEKTDEPSDTPALDALIRMDKSLGPPPSGEIRLAPQAERAFQYLEKLDAEHTAKLAAKPDGKKPESGRS